MPRKEDWLRVRAEILAEGRDPLKSRRVKELYTLAIADGMTHLRRKFHRLDDGQREDLMHEVLARTLPILLDAENTPNPRGLFITSLVNEQLSSLRKPASKEVSFGRYDEIAGQTSSTRTEVRSPQGRLEAQQELKHYARLLGPTEAQVVSAVAAGENREDIARALGTTRTNVDQILSRARKKMREERSARAAEDEQ